VMYGFEKKHGWEKKLKGKKHRFRNKMYIR
jgi:hypothetical protein